MSSRVLHVVSSDAPPIADIENLLSRARAAGWTTCLVVTPATERFLGDRVAAIEAAAGFPVRAHCLAFGAADPFPPADAVLVAPLTFNSLNKWALGISDTAALGVLNERLGQDVPMVCLPYVSVALTRHPAYREHVSLLRGMGVTVVDEGMPGPDSADRYDPDGYATTALDALARATGYVPELA